jgi:hypothetical protein
VTFSSDISMDDRYKPTNYDEVGKDWDDHHKVTR